MEQHLKDPFYRSLLDSLPIGIFCTDAGGNGLFANKFLCELVRTPYEQCMGDAWIKLLHPDDRQFVAINWDAAARLGLPFNMEYRFLLDNYKVIWVYCQATPLFAETGKMNGYIGCVMDISERKTFNAGTQEAKNIQEYFELGLESAKAGVWSWDIINNTVIWDKRVYELFDVTPTRPFQTYEDFLSYIHPNDIGPVKNAVRLAFIKHSSSTNDYRIDFRVIMRNKSIHHLKGAGRVYFNESGAPVFMTGICRDYTEQMENEYRLRQQQNELKDVARQQAVSETTSSLAHELNQPLTAIATYAQLCTKQMQPGNIITDELLKAMQHIAKQTERAGNIIHGIKNAARQQALRYENTSISQLINESIELLDYENTGKLPKLIVEITANLPAINLDRIQIQQVIINLINNSIEALQEKNCRKQQIKIRAILEDKDKIAITIADNGVGIPPSLKMRIFEPYFTTKKTGLGIGLAICRSIIEAHCGQLVLCYSNKSKGTCFKFTLPLG